MSLFLKIEHVLHSGEERGLTVTSACLFSHVPCWPSPTACEVALPNRLTDAAGPFVIGRPCARSLTVQGKRKDKEKQAQRQREKQAHRQRESTKQGKIEGRNIRHVEHETLLLPGKGLSQVPDMASREENNVS